MALTDFLTGATDALQEALLEREVRRRQAMLDALTKQKAEADMVNQASELELRKQQEARMAEALAQTRELQEAAKRQQRAQNIAKTQRPGAVTEETADLLNEFGYSGIIKRTPGVRLPVMAGLPASLGGPSNPETISEVQVTDDALESMGGSDYQESRLISQERAAAATAAREAKAEEDQRKRDFEERENKRDRDMKALIISMQQSGNAETRALGNEMKRLQIEAAQEKLETTRADKDKKLSEARQSTQTALDSVKKLLDPNDVGRGISKATGAYEVRGFTQEATDFNAERDMLVAALTLPNLGALKGPMSDKDVIFVKQLATKLANTRMSETETRKELQRARTFLESKLAGTADTSSGSVKRYNPATGKVE